MAQSLVTKRQNIANEAVEAVMRFVDAMVELQTLSEERLKLTEDFQQTDFDNILNNGLSHLTPEMLGTLFDFVVGGASGMVTWYTDVANAGRNKQILLQVRR